MSNINYYAVLFGHLSDSNGFIVTERWCDFVSKMDCVN